jgi:ubiquinone/menaquinone biosynthesis C-methylase UbiE
MSVSEAYNQWSRTYESVANSTRDLAARVLRYYPLKLENRNVLELGCGTGLNTRYLAQESNSVLAVDFSAGMLDRASSNLTAHNVRFVQSDIQGWWPLIDCVIDVVVCTLVLEHIPRLDHIFQESARVLRPGGEFFLCELHPFRQLQGRQAKFVDPGSGNEVLVPAFLHYISDYLNASIEQRFELIHMDEWRSKGEDNRDAPPRLLSVHVRYKGGERRSAMNPQ